MTTTMQQLSPAQANQEARINELMESLSAAGLFSRRHAVTTGLTWGYYGGRYNGNTIADGTVTLTNAATNYVVVARATGVVSVATTTTNWLDATNYARLYQITTAGSVVTAIVDERFGTGGLLNGGGSGGAASGSGNAVVVETQARQSRRYLMADGTLRDPLVVGTGGFSVGAAATIADTSRYLAWPVACRLRNRSILLGYTDAADHHGGTDGKAVGRIGVEDANGAITWGAQFDIYDDPSKFATVYGVSQVSSGRVFATLWTDSGSGSTDGRAYIAYSDNNGTTWSAPINVHAATGFALGSWGSGPVVELPNGDLVVTVEGYDAAETYLNTDSKLLRSTDGGLTWGSAVLIAGTNGTPRPYFESKLLLLDNDRLLCVHRTTGGTGTSYTNYSDDNGATWSTPVAAFAGYGAPSCVQLSSGTIIVTTRRNSDGKTCAFASLDRGATWGSEIVIDTGGFEMEYACPLELLDGRVLVVYGDQPTSSLTNADIDQRILTEVLGQGLEVWEYAISDETTALTTGTAKLTTRARHAMKVLGVRASLSTASSSGNPTFDVNVGGVSIFSTTLTIDASEKTSVTAAVPAVLTGVPLAIADDAEITFDIDTAGTGATGAKIALIGVRA